MADTTSAFQDFSFGDGDENIGTRGKRFKAEGGRTYRMSFLRYTGLDAGKPDLGTPDNPKAPRFLGASTNFISGVGHVVNKVAEYTQLAGEAPKKRVCTIIIVWPTDKSGKVDKVRLAANEAEVLTWTFSGDKYKNLMQIHEEFPFGTHDITAACPVDGTQYQKLTFAPCKENLLRTLMANPKAAEHVKVLIEAGMACETSIKDEVGRELSIAQIREKMTGAATGATAGSPATTASGDIDSLVDGLLD